VVANNHCAVCLELGQCLLYVAVVGDVRLPQQGGELSGEERPPLPLVENLEQVFPEIDVTLSDVRQAPLSCTRPPSDALAVRPNDRRPLPAAPTSPLPYPFLEGLSSTNRGLAPPSTGHAVRQPGDPGAHPRGSLRVASERALPAARRKKACVCPIRSRAT
jgi:hypothetical protein